MSRRRISKPRRFLELFCLLVGLAGIGVFVWSHVRLAVSEREANRALDRKIATPTVPPATPRIEPPPPPGALLGRLSIPRLNLQAVVREGATHDTLDVAAGHIAGTALPGQKGNVGVAGHRDTLFRGLRNIRKDDRIDFQTPSGSYTYQVENTQVVTPRDVGVLRAGDYSELTLVTCYPFYYIGSAPNRFIVKARLMEEPGRGTVEGKPLVAAAPSAPPARSAAPPARVVPAKPVRVAAKKPPARRSARKLNFVMARSQTREIAPGIRMSLSSTDATRASGWIYMTPERRTIWLRNVAVKQPLMFQRRELMLTKVTKDSVAGYLVVFP